MVERWTPYPLERAVPLVAVHDSRLADTDEGTRCPPDDLPRGWFVDVVAVSHRQAFTFRHTPVTDGRRAPAHLRDTYITWTFQRNGRDAVDQHGTDVQHTDRVERMFWLVHGR